MSSGGDLDTSGTIGTVGSSDDCVLVEDISAAHIKAVNEEENKVGIGMRGGFVPANNPARATLGVLGHHVGVEDYTVLQGGGVCLVNEVNDVIREESNYFIKEYYVTEAAATKRARATMVFMVPVCVWTTQTAVLVRSYAHLFIPASPFANRDMLRLLNVECLLEFYIRFRVT